MIEAKADLEAQNNEGMTALLGASAIGHTEVGQPYPSLLSLALKLAQLQLTPTLLISSRSLSN